LILAILNFSFFLIWRTQYDVKAFVKIEEHIKLKIEKYNVKVLASG